MLWVVQARLAPTKQNSYRCVQKKLDELDMTLIKCF